MGIGQMAAEGLGTGQPCTPARHTQREVTEAFLSQIPSLRLHTVKDVLSGIKTIISEIRFYVY